jgi:type IV secretory pathway VirB10-like protein
MLMPGEELLLAPSVSEPAAAMPANEPENAPAAAAVEPAAQQPPVAASEMSEPAAEPAASETREPAAESPATSEESEPAAESQAAKNETSEPVDTASDAPFDIPAVAKAYLPDERKLIGLGIFVLTFLLALLMLWKLPMRRDIGGTETWTTTSALASYKASRRGRTSGVSSEQPNTSSQPQKSTSGFANKAPTNGQAERYVDLPVAMGARRKLTRTPRGSLARKRRARKGWATGVYSSPVRCALRRAAASAQTRSVLGGARGKLLGEAHQRRS